MQYLIVEVDNDNNTRTVLDEDTETSWHDTLSDVRRYIAAGWRYVEGGR